MSPVCRPHRHLRLSWVRLSWRCLAVACDLLCTEAHAESCRTHGPLPAGAVMASWYGAEHHGHRTASGERYDERQLTAAHPLIPLQTIIRIRNLLNGRIVKVRITDRGPGYGRGIDLSEAAAEMLGMRQCGLAPVLLTLDRPGD